MVAGYLCYSFSTNWQRLNRPYNDLFSFDASYIGIWNKDDGFVIPESCIETQLALAQERGVTLLTNSEVLSIENGSDEITISASEGEIVASKVIVTAGAWAKNLLEPLALEIT